LGPSVSQKRDSIILKLIALLSSVRWKSILLVILAQYIAFLFAFNTKEEIWNSLGEFKVHLIILSTALILAGGYIINNFYDIEKDMVNRPHQTRFQNLVSRGFKLRLYLLLNFLGLAIALYASVNIFLFFLMYSVLLWYYSHKLNKLVLIRELTASFLTVMAFFSLVLYYKMVTVDLFLYGASLFLVLFGRELYKDINGVKGDVVYGYGSITTSIGIVASQRIFQVIILFSLLVDSVFLWLNGKIEFVYILGFIVLLKLALLLLIDRNIKPMNWVIKLTIFIYVLGVAWL
jgi:4-hydroxybenzoate polyprenyltransferase